MMDEVDMASPAAVHSQKIKVFLGSSHKVRETHLEVSTASVVLTELAPDSHRKTTQIAPNGKRVAP